MISVVVIKNDTIFLYHLFIRMVQNVRRKKRNQ